MKQCNWVNAFVEQGKMQVKDKYLVVRRDGSIPDWPWLVLGGRSPWALEAAKAYVAAAERGGADEADLEAVRGIVAAMEAYPKGGDHDDGPDDPSIVQVMRDCRGGKLFVSSAWDQWQVKREAEKDKELG